MLALRHAADLPPMSDSERGQAIQDRLGRLGISDREFHDQTGIDRKTLRRAVAGEENVRPSTYAAIESALTKLEERVKPPSLSTEPANDVIEFDISGDFGVHVVVKGPVADADLLQRQVLGIIREIRKGDPPPEK